MKRLPLSLQTFSKIIEGNYVYVDKTEHIYNLIKNDCVFFSRPRRFGKSILCSTLKELFQGNKELFKDLWIAKNTNYDWKTYPVIHLDFLTIASSTPGELKESLMRTLNGIAEFHDLTAIVTDTPKEMLKNLAIKLYKKYGSKNRVVLIIDEYDKPIVQHITNLSIAIQMRTILREFYESIKGLDEYLHFVFIVGVSRFSKTSIFSGLNHLLDLTLDPRAAHLVGYTKEEIELYLREHLLLIAQQMQCSLEELFVKIAAWYNGYRFWKDEPVGRVPIKQYSTRLYSPFSIHRFIDAAEFNNYWFESGTPTILIDLLKKNNYPIETLDNLKATSQELSSFEIEKPPLQTLLYQTGYLTIQSYDEETTNFLLTYPNKEVKDSLLGIILASLTKHEANQINDYTKKLFDCLSRCDVDSFIKTLQSFYGFIPNTIHISQEKYYQTIFYTILKLIGADIEVEISTNIGRIDAVVATQDYLYVIEFKLNKAPSIALEQIKQKKYFERYLDDKRVLILLGINFSSQEKNIVEYIVEELDHKV